MTTTKTTKVKGMYNSSLTRVRPFFQRLFELDSTGRQWLPPLLKALPLNKALSEKLSNSNAMITKDSLQKREYNDKIMQLIDLESCFEYRIPPTMCFLSWALNNPDMLTWPENGKKEFSTETQYKRECLFGHHGVSLQQSTKEEGLSLIDSEGVYRSSKQWWAFEGFTEMDCLIETDEYLLGIEGKRTEFISSSTYWFQDRNQVARNLECLKEIADHKGKKYAFILITENGQDPISRNHFIHSLPHDETLAVELYNHYLGCLSWDDACKATGISNQCLLDDISSLERENATNHVDYIELNGKKESAYRTTNYKLFRIHGRLKPEKDSYEAKLRNDLYMVGSLKINTGLSADNFRMVRLIGYEVPLYNNQPRNKCIDLLGYDEDHNLYIIELKINLAMKPKDVSDQLQRYYLELMNVRESIAQEISHDLHIEDFKLTHKMFKIALVPKDFPKEQWDENVLVCSIDGRTKIDNLVENRGTIGFVTLDILVNRKIYLDTINH